MDYQWYFPQSEGGGGGGTSGTEISTDTIPVTEEMSSTKFRKAVASPALLAWTVEAFEEKDGVQTPVEVQTKYSPSEGSADWEFDWTIPFNGYINIMSWQK